MGVWGKVLAAAVMVGLMGAGPVLADDPRLKAEFPIGKDLVRRTPPPDFDTPNAETLVEVIRDGQVFYRFSGWSVYLTEWVQAPDGVTFPPQGTNFMGGNVPQLLLQEFSGGAHCCLSLYLVDLGAEPVQHDLPVGSHYFTYFERDPADGRWVLHGHDPNYAYWKASFIGSPAPKLKFVYEKGDWVLAPSQRTKAPARSELLAMVAQMAPVDDSEGAEVSSDLWAIALDLVYGGHWDLAREFVRDFWPRDVAGRDAFMAELFECKIPQSQYWPHIARLNGIPANPPKGECD